MERIFSVLVLTLISTLIPSLAQAEKSRLTTADRLALLYAPQFNLTREGEPLINVGVSHGLNEVSFSSRHPVTVLPLGEGGPEVTLEGGRSYQVKLTRGQAGVYKYWLVVQRYSYKNNNLLETTIDAWAKRGYLPQTFEAGGLFTVGGQRFDTRSILVSLGGLTNRADVQVLRERLLNMYGIEAENYSEMLSHPTGQLELRSVNAPSISVRHSDILWVMPTRDGQTFRIETSAGERSFAGSIVFAVHRDGSLAVINTVPVETLLKGVVPSEVYSSAPMESLKAQAIAARGTLISALGSRHLTDPYLLCNSVHCQVYSGLTNSSPRTDAAVEATRGELMFASTHEQALEIVDARYSANCGGSTEHNEHVWGGEPKAYLRGHADTDGNLDARYKSGITAEHLPDWINSKPSTWCNTQRYGGKKSFRWEKSVPVKTLAAKLSKGEPRVGEVLDVSILTRGVSGRVTNMAIKGSEGDRMLSSELAIRRAFGGLRSSMFLLQITRDSQGRPETFHFKGGGFGHGVGMCQTGAMMMAHGDKPYREILKHYYKGIAIKKLY